MTPGYILIAARGGACLVRLWRHPALRGLQGLPILGSSPGLRLQVTLAPVSDQAAVAGPCRGVCMAQQQVTDLRGLHPSTGLQTGCHEAATPCKSHCHHARDCLCKLQNLPPTSVGLSQGPTAAGFKALQVRCGQAGYNLRHQGSCCCPPSTAHSMSGPVRGLVRVLLDFRIQGGAAFGSGAPPAAWFRVQVSGT